MLTLDYLSDTSYQDLLTLYGIDRTEFIHHILTDSHAALCFLRPKGFLQSTLLAMLAQFLDLKQNLTVNTFFKKADIIKFPQSARQQGQWPVIYIDLNGLTEATTKDEFDQYLNQVIYYHCKKYDIEISREGASPLKALLRLIEQLYTTYQRECYLIINGVDEPFRFDNMQPIQASWMQLLSKTVKNNPYVLQSILCGVMRPGYNVEGSMNNYRLFNMVDCNRYTHYFGLTVKEAELITKAEQGDAYTVKQLKKQNGGYHYISDEMIQPDAILTKFFATSPSDQYSYLNQILKNLYPNQLDDLLDSYLKRKPFHFYFEDTAIFYPDGQVSYRCNQLLSLLVLCGFLTPVAPNSTLFRIPNKQRYQQLYHCLMQQQIQTPQMKISDDFFANHSQTLFAQKTLKEKRLFVIAQNQKILMQDEKRALKILPLMKNEDELEKAYTKIEKFYSYQG